MNLRNLDLIASLDDVDAVSVKEKGRRVNTAAF